MTYGEVPIREAKQQSGVELVNTLLVLTNTTPGKSATEVTSNATEVTSKVQAYSEPLHSDSEHRKAPKARFWPWLESFSR